MQFYEHGCPNCTFLDWEVREIVEGATTKSYEGLVAMMQPKESWVAKWQRIGKCDQTKVASDAIYFAECSTYLIM